MHLIVVTVMLFQVGYDPINKSYYKYEQDCTGNGYPCYKVGLAIRPNEKAFNPAVGLPLDTILQSEVCL